MFVLRISSGPVHTKTDSCIFNNLNKKMVLKLSVDADFYKYPNKLVAVNVYVMIQKQIKAKITKNNLLHLCIMLVRGQGRSLSQPQESARLQTEDQLFTAWSMTRQIQMCAELLMGISSSFSVCKERCSVVLAEWAVAGCECRILACVKKQSWCLEQPHLHLSCCFHLRLSLTLVGAAAHPALLQGYCQPQRPFMTALFEMVQPLTRQ